jgi:hypothetical protein
MRQKTLIALAVVTVPVLAAALFVPSRQGTALKPVETGLVFPTLKDWLGGASKLTITGAGGSVVTLTRTVPAAAGDALPVTGWGLADKSGYPVPDGVIRPIIAGLAALHTIEAKTERPKLYDRLDVEDPTGSKDAKSKLIELDNADGAEIVKLIVGRRRFDRIGGNGDAVYIRKPEDERAWLAQPAFEVPADAMGWIDRKIVDLEPDKIKSLTLTQAGDPPLVLERAKPEDNFTVRDLPKDATLRSETPGSDIASAFRLLDLQDVRPAAEVTGTPAATVELESFDGLSITVSLYDQSGATWVEATAKGAGDAAKEADEIVNRTKGWAYKIPDPRVKTLESKLADLLTPVPAAVPAPKPAEPAAKPAPEPAKPAKPPARVGK